MSTTITVVVFGATGQQGGSVLRALASDSKYHIRAITRSTTSKKVLELALKYPHVSWHETDTSSNASVSAAVANADVVFGMTQYTIPSESTKSGSAEIDEGRRIIDACVNARVQFVVFSTLPSALQISAGECTQVKHFEDKYAIQQYLCEQEGVDWAVVQPAVYLQNVPASARLDDEGVRLAFGFVGDVERKIPYVDVGRDFGSVVKYVIDNRKEYAKRVVPAVSGFYSPREIVDAFTEVTGIEAAVVNVPFEFVPDKNLRAMFEFLDRFDLFAQSDTCDLPLEFSTLRMFWEHCNFRGLPKKL
ncbi:hypothetical protein IWW50_001064 [Coemansia erecta]|nr:hypothetical protein IWW50_001064 [Coemansia erecta]